MSSIVTEFPDQTYTSSNKPSVETLQSDISTIETGHNDLETTAMKLAGTQTVTGNKTYSGTSLFTGNVIAKLLGSQGFMINGKVSVTVASNNLTVAIKTLAGTDPGAADPVYVRIGDTVRSITAALSITKNAGTNWCNSGSSELAAKAVDYSVYLGYNATDGVVIGFSRFPGANQYGDFSATTTNEKYCAISTITTAASTDYYEVIGRFEATLSAGAGYTWSVPTYTAANLIQRPIYETRWLDWTPVGSVSGGTAPTYTLIDVNKYRIVNNTIYWKCDRANAAGGTAGSGTNRLVFTLPFNHADFTIDRSTVGGGFGTESAGTSASLFSFQDTDAKSMCFLTAAGASWAGNDQSSTDRRFSGQGFYRI